MSQTTKERLLQAANRVFTEQGYEGATVQMIAEAAGANIAAVNYHYGSKADLYAEYAASHLKSVMAKMPRLADRPADPLGQLRKFIAWFFIRFQPDAPLRRLNQDMLQMKPDFTTVILEQVIRPEFANCRELVTAILPPGTPETDIRCWVKSIISLCTGPLHGAHLYPQLFPGVTDEATEMQHYVDHLAQFIADGLAAASARLAVKSASRLSTSGRKSKQ